MKYDTSVELPLFNHEKNNLESLQKKRNVILGVLRDIQKESYPDEVKQEIKIVIGKLDNAQLELDKELREMFGKIYWRIFLENEDKK